MPAPPKISEAYDPAELRRIVQTLSQRIEALENQIQVNEVQSLDSHVISQMQDGGLYFYIDSTRQGLELCLRARGRLYRFPMVTDTPAGSAVLSTVFQGTTNRITITHGTKIIFSTPQDTHTDATPEFERLGLGTPADGSLSLKTIRGVLIDGSADEIQLRVQGHSSQTALLLVVEDSGGNDQFTVSTDGLVVVNEEGNAAGDLRAEGDTETNLLLVDASDDAVYFGGSATGKIGMHKSTGAVARSTGWAVTNVTPDKTFDADSLTLDELADVIGTLLTFLLSRGDLGA